MSSRVARAGCGFLACALLPACSEAGQQHASVPLFVAGAEVARPITATGDVQVTIERAQLAFGPLYLCAGFEAGDLCDTARLEWLDSAVVDLLDAAPRQVGMLEGTTGSVRSWMYDLGISSQLTRDEPFVLSAATELGGASLLISGHASSGDISLTFTTAVVIEQGAEVERGVPVIRKRTSDPFGHDVTHREAGLWLHFDAVPWIESLNFGSELESCMAAQDCEEGRQLEPTSPIYVGLHNAVVLGKRPSFSWEPVP